MTCPRCNEMCPPDAAKFCRECGATLILTDGDRRALRRLREDQARTLADDLLARVREFTA